MEHENYFFLKGDGECASIARAFNWSTTSLGSPETWPISLRSTVALVLNSEFPMFIWWGPDLVQLYNDAFRVMLGDNGKHPKAIGQRAIDCWPENWDIIYPLIKQVMTTGKAVYYEDMKIPIYRNGALDYGFWTFSYSPLYGDTGLVEGVTSVCSETTDKILSLYEVSESKNELQFAIDAAEMGTWELNPATGKITTNDRLKEWFGLQPEDDVPLNRATDVIIEADRQKVIDAINASIAPGGDGKYEISYTIVNPVTKQERFVLAKGRAHFDDEGKPYHFNGILQDLTASKKAEQEITAAQQMAELAIKTVGIGIYKVDLATDKMDYSPELATIFTGDPDKKISRNDFLDYLHPDDRHFRRAAMRSGLEKGEFQYTARVIWDDGSVHKIAVNGALIHDNEGKPLALSGTARDITSEEGQRLALMEAEEEIIAGRKKLSQSETLFRSIIEQAPVATCLFAGREMKVEVANDMMLEYWGRDRTVIGLPLEEAVPELKGQPFLQILDDVFTTGIPYSDNAAKVDLSLGGVFGTYYFDFTYKPLRNADGTIYGVMDMAVDVTSQVLLQQEIQENQRRLLASFEQSPVGIATIEGDDLAFKMANAFYCELVGRTREELIDQPLLKAIPELEGQGFDLLLKEVLATGVPYTANDVPVNLVRNGIKEIIYVDLTYQPRYDAQENIIGILVVATDMTQQVVTRKEIEEAQKALRNAVELAELATWKMDIKSGKFFYSERFMEWLGFTENSKDIEGAYAPLPEDYRDKVAAAIDKAIAPGTSGIYDNEHPIVNTVTGQTRIIHATAQVIYDIDGHPESLNGTAQDVTKERKIQKELESMVSERTAELKAANDELELANHNLEDNNLELQQFAYIASHDLQEPIRKIAVYMQMLESNLSDVTPKSQGYIDKINSSAKRMTNLIRDVLGFSQLSKRADKYVKVSLNDVAQETLSEFDLIIEQKAAIVDFPELPVIEAIPLQMSQLFGNLVSNALKYAKEGISPVIRITSQKASAEDLKQHSVPLETDYFLITFSDNGIGFEQEYAEKIFNIFQRLHGKGEYVGTGIGLSMCRKIVQNHKGSIWADSRPGEGTVFSILLPGSQEK